MAWAEPRKTAKGVAYYRAAWRDEAGKVDRESTDPATGRRFAHKKIAEAYAWKREDEARGVNVTNPSSLYAEWLDKWLAVRQVEGSTDKEDRNRIDKHVRPKWGPIKTKKISRLDGLEWISELDEIVKPWTVRRIWYNFSTPLRFAHEHGALLQTPIPYMIGKDALPKPAPGHERYLKRDRLDTLLDALGTPGARDRALAGLLLGTGARFGEATGLHRERVDLDRQVVHIVETWDRASQKMKGYPKGQKLRTVPLPNWAAAELAAWFEVAADLGSCGYPHAAGTRCTSSLVVTGDKGAPVNREHFAYDRFKPAAARAGERHFRIHDSRHTYASWLIQAGVDLAVVSELLGHHSVVVTAKYAHLGEAHHDDVRVALSGEQRGSREHSNNPGRLAIVKDLTPRVVIGHHGSSQTPSEGTA